MRTPKILLWTLLLALLKIQIACRSTIQENESYTEWGDKTQTSEYVDLTEPTPIGYHQEENGSTFTEEYTFESNGFIKFGLHKNTRFETESLNISEINGKFYYSFTNLHTNELFIYELTDGHSPLLTIPLPIQGPNRVGKLETKHHHHILINLDSLYLLNDNILYLLNTKGELLHKVKLIELNESNRELGRTNPNIINPIVRKKDWLYIPCYSSPVHNNFDKHKVILKYNMKTDELIYIRNLPDLYNQAFWGGTHKYRVTIADHVGTDKLLLSFPIDPFVYIADENGVFLDKKFVGSQFLKPLLPLSEDKLWPFSDIENKSLAMTLYNQTHSEYGGLLYDPYHRLYYRLALIKPLADRDHYYNHTIIIMDEHLNKVGEKFFRSEQYSYPMKFITPEGLHIARRDLYQKDNQTLTYEIWKPTKVLPVVEL